MAWFARFMQKSMYVLILGQPLWRSGKVAE
jgi:hypothetical protein